MKLIITRGSREFIVKTSKLFEALENSGDYVWIDIDSSSDWLLKKDVQECFDCLLSASVQRGTNFYFSQTYSQVERRNLDREKCAAALEQIVKYKIASGPTAIAEDLKKVDIIF